MADSESSKTPERRLVRRLPLPQRMLLRFYLWGVRKLKGFRGELMAGLEKLKVGLAAETDQTREMLDIYQKQILGQATTEEVARANKQFRDVIKGMGLGVLLVLPFSPVTLPLIVKLGRKLGIEVLPDSFREDKPE